MACSTSLGGVAVSLEPGARELGTHRKAPQNRDYNLPESRATAPAEPADRLAIAYSGLVSNIVPGTSG